MREPWLSPETIRRTASAYREFEAVGFSRRAANVLAYSNEVSGLDDLRQQAWDDEGERQGLARRLLRTPNCGQAVLNEIRAYREHGDPRRRIASTVRVALDLDPDTAARLDAWIARQGVPQTRARAIRAMLDAELARADNSPHPP